MYVVARLGATPNRGTRTRAGFAAWRVRAIETGYGRTHTSRIHMMPGRVGMPPLAGCSMWMPRTMVGAILCRLNVRTG